MKNALRHNHPDDASELISSYLDEALSLVERRRVDRLLHECDACSAELQELRALRQLLRSVPAPLPRRSFTLDPSVGAPRMRLFPIFRFASLAAALLLFVVLGFDALGRGAQPQATSASQSAEQEQMRTLGADPTEAPAAAMDMPPAAGGALAEPTTEAAAESAPAAALQAPAPTTGAETANEEQMEAAAAEAPADAAGKQGGTDQGEQAGDEGADAESSTLLTQAPPAAADTTELDEGQTTGQPPRREWLDGWRLTELLLAAVVLALGGATWWAARHEHR